MLDDVGTQLPRFAKNEVGDDVKSAPLTTEEFEALLRIATENDNTAKASSQTWDVFDIVCLAAPTLGALTMLAWIWLSRQFD